MSESQGKGFVVLSDDIKSRRETCKPVMFRITEMIIVTKMTDGLLSGSRQRAGKGREGGT